MAEKLRVVPGKRASMKHRSSMDEEVRIIFIPVLGTIICVDADTFYPYQIQQPVAVTVPRAALGYLAPEP